MDFVKQAFASLFVLISLGTCVARAPIVMEPMDQVAGAVDEAAAGEGS